MSKKKLPKDWQWVKLGDECEFTQGIQVDVKKQKFEKFENCVQFLRIIDFTQVNEPPRYIENPGERYILKKNEIAMVRYGTVGFVCINKIGAIANNLFKINPSKKIYPKYLINFFNSLLFRSKLETKGATMQALSFGLIKPIQLPLPPLETQHAIVSKIEELFSELDKGIAELKTAQQQLKTYRQSVLKSAFEGKLTNENVKDGELPDGWKVVKISDISKVVRGGSPRPAGDPKYYDGDIPFLKVADLTKDNGIYLTTFKYTIKEAGLHKTRQITPNTLLLSNSGATLGVPKICMINATMNDGVAAFLELDIRSNHYLYYFWLSKTLELRGINMGAGQPNLNTDLIKDYKVPYCSFEEQHRIVQEIESRLSVADKMEQSIQESLQKAEALRQSILKKAFCGELV